MGLAAVEIAAPQPGTPPHPIDRAHLARFTFGNAELELEVLALFAQQAPETLAMLEEATTPKAWRDAAHTVKGSARAVGAWAVAGAAEQAEGLSFAADAAARRLAIGAIRIALDEAIRYVRTLPVAA